MKYFILLFTIYLFAKPQLDEPKVLEPYEIPHKFKNIKEQKYDVLSLSQYIKTLYVENKSTLDYQEKSDYLSNDITQDKYNFDVYLSGYLKTGKKISADVQNSVVYTEKGIAIYLNKLLFDRDYFLSKKYTILYQRLANINKINRKNAILIAGVTTYMNLYFAQQELKLLKEIKDSQEKIFDNTEKNVKLGKLSKIDLIASKNDLLNLKNSIILAKEKYLKNDYILRQSINSHSKKPFLVQPFMVNLNVNSIYEIQKRVLKNNSEIASNSNILKIKKLQLLSEQKRFVPQVSYYSYAGYSGGRNKLFSISSNLNTQNWEIGLNMKVPLYNRNDITLKTQKAKYDILLQQDRFKKTIKNNLIKANNLFQSIVSIKAQIKILLQKIELSKEKLDIYKGQLLLGMIPYKKYSPALNQYINNLKKLQNLQQQKAINIFLLNILLGEKIVE